MTEANLREEAAVRGGLAVSLAQDPARLAALKAALRAAVASGPLFDIAGFARKLEAGYDRIWAAG